MWTSLQDQRQIEFYENAQRSATGELEDWKPMIRLIRALQEHEYASKLFAFTSLLHFHIVAVTDYSAVDQATETIGITWAWRDRLFHLRQQAGTWLNDGPPLHICGEDSVIETVAPMIEKLFDSSRQGGRNGAA